MQSLANSLPYLLHAALTTLWLALLSIALSTLFGVLAGVFSAVGGKLLSSVIIAVVYVIRGIPILVQLFLVYFGLPYVGVMADPYTIAVLGISLHMGALISEIVRGALVSLPRSQTDGGLALGLTYTQLVWKVLLPQALRAALPPYIGLIPVTVKATSLASVINIWELTLASKEVASQTLNTFQTFGFAFAIYFLLCYPFTWLGNRLERRTVSYRI
jgi:His/Glu/Gln/Arg/opine family amino acid ABC transporter permease subunit